MFTFSFRMLLTYMYMFVVLVNNFYPIDNMLGA